MSEKAKAMIKRRLTLNQNWTEVDPWDYSHAFSAR
jgi:hypothetical protein